MKRRSGQIKRRTEKEGKEKKKEKQRKRIKGKDEEKVEKMFVIFQPGDLTQFKTQKCTCRRELNIPPLRNPSFSFSIHKRTVDG